MKHIKKSSSPPRLAALLAGAVLLGMLSQSAMALGTASGTTVGNIAKLSYSVGGVGQGDICSSVAGNSTADDDGVCVSGAFGAVQAAFVVDNKVNLLVAKDVDASVVPGSTNQAVAFTLTNTGNTTQRYALSATAGADTMTGGMGAVSVYRDVNNNNAWDVGDTLYVDASTFGDVAANGTLNLIVVGNVPGTALNGESAAFNLVAATVNAGTTTLTVDLGAADTAGVDVVFGDIAGSDAGDLATDGKHSAFATFTVASAVLTVSKTASLVCDPFNGVTNPKNIPGAITKWTVTVSNAGPAAATLTTVSDTLAAALVHDANLVVPVDAATCDATAVAVAENAAGDGFKVTVGASRILGGSAAGAGTVSYFTSANDVDGVENNAGAITATFSAILPIDGGTGHATAGLLNAGETVSVIFNTTVQ